MAQTERLTEQLQKNEKLYLAMLAGARAIRNTRRYDAATFVHDIFEVNGKRKEISYYEAANILIAEAEVRAERR